MLHTSQGLGLQGTRLPTHDMLSWNSSKIIAQLASQHGFSRSPHSFGPSGGLHRLVHDAGPHSGQGCVGTSWSHDVTRAGQ